MFRKRDKSGSEDDSSSMLVTPRADYKAMTIEDMILKEHLGPSPKVTSGLTSARSTVKEDPQFNSLTQKLRLLK